MAKQIANDEEKIEVEKEMEEVKKARSALANLILKIVDDINDKRVREPEQTYNALANMYTAIK